MNKRIKLIMLTVLFLVLGGSTTFSFFHSMLRPAVTIFTENFLQLTSNNSSVIKTVYLFTKAPLEKQLQNRLLRLKCEDEVNVKIGVTQLIDYQQEEALKELQKDGIWVISLPESYDYVDWKEIYDEDQCLRNVELVENCGFDPLIQVALISYCSKERVALFGKDKEAVGVHELLSTKETLDILQRDFNRMFRKSKK